MLTNTLIKVFEINYKYQISYINDIYKNNKKICDELLSKIKAIKKDFDEIKIKETCFFKEEDIYANPSGKVIDVVANLKDSTAGGLIKVISISFLLDLTMGYI